MCLMDNMGAAHLCMAEATLLAMTESYILKEIAVKTPEFSVGNMPLSTDRIKTLSSSPLACQCYQRTVTLRWTSVCPERQRLAAGRCQSLLTGFLLPLTQHMREAAERRQQLELEHEQALAVLNAKQQEIELLQKVSGERASGGKREIAVTGHRAWNGAPALHELKPPLVPVLHGCPCRCNKGIVTVGFTGLNELIYIVPVRTKPTNIYKPLYFPIGREVIKYVHFLCISIASLCVVLSNISAFIKYQEGNWS